jgi:[ribosomal protein S18]-alanine N-acetyltransferase
MALSKSPQPFVIAKMEVEDIDAVMEIERLSFPAPWSRQVLLEEMTRDWARLEVVRSHDSGEVVGFANYWLVADELHVLNIATHPEHRQRGHATRMLAHMVAVARVLLCCRLTLEVRRSNVAAQRLYRRFAFRSVGVRPNYYAEDPEDAIVMLLDLT